MAGISLRFRHGLVYLMAMPNVWPREVLTVDHVKLYCDGGVGADGHPRVFLTMNESDFVDCPYCGRRFVLNPACAHPREH